MTWSCNKYRENNHLLDTWKRSSSASIAVSWICIIWPRHKSNIVSWAWINIWLYKLYCDSVSTMFTCWFNRLSELWTVQVGKPALKTTLCRLKGLTTWEWCSLRGCIQPHRFVLSTWGIQHLSPASVSYTAHVFILPLKIQWMVAKRLINLTWCAHGNKYLIIKKTSLLIQVDHQPHTYMCSSAFC